MNFEEFEELILEAYENRCRSDLWLTACLMQEAGELSENIIKYVGYNKKYTKDAIISEAGDILNFLTAILQSHNLCLEDAMKDNIIKLKARGWIK